MADRKILPKTQAQLSQATITPYDKLNKGKEPLQTPKKRGERRSVKNDDVKQFQVGLRDIDETIVYYFNNVIKPSVVQNGRRINVPILYGSPERWAAVQKDGFYRDKNGKIQTPLIMFKRDIIEYLKHEYFNFESRTHEFGAKSCEMLAKEILEEFNEIESNKPDPVIKSFFEKAKKFWRNS